MCPRAPGRGRDGSGHRRRRRARRRAPGRRRRTGRLLPGPRCPPAGGAAPWPRAGAGVSSPRVIQHSSSRVRRAALARWSRTSSAASAVQPARPITTPLARSTTTVVAACSRSRSISARCWATTLASPTTSGTLPDPAGAKRSLFTRRAWHTCAYSLTGWLPSIPAGTPPGRSLRARTRPRTRYGTGTGRTGQHGSVRGSAPAGRACTPGVRTVRTPYGNGPGRCTGAARAGRARALRACGGRRTGTARVCARGRAGPYGLRAWDGRRTPEAGPGRRLGTRGRAKRPRRAVARGHGVNRRAVMRADGCAPGPGRTAVAPTRIPGPRHAVTRGARTFGTPMPMPMRGRGRDRRRRVTVRGTGAWPPGRGTRVQEHLLLPARRRAQRGLSPSARVTARTLRAMCWSCISSAAYSLIVLDRALVQAEAGQVRAGGLQRGARHPYLVLDLDLGVPGQQHGVPDERRVARVARRDQLPQPLGGRAFPVVAPGVLTWHGQSGPRRVDVVTGMFFASGCTASPARATRWGGPGLGDDRDRHGWPGREARPNTLAAGAGGDRRPGCSCGCPERTGAGGRGVTWKRRMAALGLPGGRVR